MYKMNKISKEAHKKCYIEIIDKDNIFGLVEESCKQNQFTVIWQTFLTNVIQINKNTDMNQCQVQNFECVKDLQEMIQWKKKIRSCRLASEQFLELNGNLGLDPNEYSFDKQDIISASQVAFEGEIKHAQYCVQKKRLDFYFSEHKLGVEID